MAEISLGWTLGLGLPALVVQTISVATARALRVYSRSRLEEICEAAGRPERADAIARDDEAVERASESLAVISGLLIAVLAGVNAMLFESIATSEIVVVSIIAIAAIAYVVAGAIGRVFAERLLDGLWPIAPFIRTLAAPMTLIGAVAEWAAGAIWGVADAPPRPSSVEVEIPPDEDHPEAEEAELPETIRDMLERVVELARMDVSDVMVPRTAMISRPVTIAPVEAARAFRSTGLSRIPLFGENRDDIVGVLYAKDLLPILVEAADPSTVNIRKLAREPYFIPDTKMANELLAELRSRRIQIAIVLDEYGGVAGLVTLEDLLEQVVGSIEDEHDEPPPEDPITALGDGRFDVEASITLEDLNERLGLELPTEDDITTLGGYVFHVLGRLPDPGATFRSADIGFMILNVTGHSIRKVRLELGT